MKSHAKEMMRALTLVLLIATTAVLAPIQQQKQPDNQDIDVVRVNTTLVTVPVSVMDRNGRFIPDLRQDQFHLFEDGVEQQIAFFENAEQPFNVALLLDVSDSTIAKLAQIKDAAAAFVNELRADDRVMIVTFDKRVTVLAELTSDRQLLNAAIHNAQSGGGTSLYSAIDLVARRLKNIRGRKALVLFTDGVDTSSKVATYEGTLRAAEELDALIYSIEFNTSADVAKVQTQTASLDPAQGSSSVVTSRGEPLNVAYKRADRYLQLLSEKTAGRFYYAASLDHLKEIFGRIGAELRQQYSLGYYPGNKSATKTKRAVKVKVDALNVAIKSRKSYVYSATEP